MIRGTGQVLLLAEILSGGNEDNYSGSIFNMELLITFLKVMTTTLEYWFGSVIDAYVYLMMFVIIVYILDKIVKGNKKLKELQGRHK